MSAFFLTFSSNVCIFSKSNLGVLCLVHQHYSHKYRLKWSFIMFSFRCTLLLSQKINLSFKYEMFDKFHSKYDINVSNSPTSAVFGEFHNLSAIAANIWCGENCLTFRGLCCIWLIISSLLDDALRKEHSWLRKLLSIWTFKQSNYHNFKNRRKFESLTILFNSTTK